MKSTPPGKRPFTRYAASTASAVFPTPPSPASAETITTSPSADSADSNSPSNPSRPTNTDRGGSPAGGAWRRPWTTFTVPAWITSRKRPPLMLFSVSPTGEFYQQ